MQKYRAPIWGRTDYHCEYCGCPLDLWKPMDTYKNDRCCELYSDFLDVIGKLENKKISYGYRDILERCLKLKTKYPDIPDFEASLYEMIDDSIDTGVMTGLHISEPKLKVIK